MVNRSMSLIFRSKRTKTLWQHRVFSFLRRSMF
nr:MAG TPA: hypothetical protein [Caudoviricetes sp.]